MSTESPRFQSAGEHLLQFTGEVLVRCPHCEGCAHIRLRSHSEKLWWFSPRVVTCTACGFSRHWQESGMVWGVPTAAEESFFHLPLWLQRGCCGRTLWAYNGQQLDFMEALVAARLRERVRRDGHWINGSLASRLPGWLLAAGHRQAVLHAIHELRATLPVTVSQHVSSVPRQRR